METHFLNEAVTGLERPEAAPFSPLPWYNPHGDCIVYQIEDEAVVADRVDEFLTIYRSAEDDRPIGFELKEVMALVRTFGCDTLRVDAELKGDELISVRALYLAAYEQVPKSIRRRQAYASAPLPHPGRDTVAIPQQSAA